MDTETNSSLPPTTTAAGSKVSGAATEREFSPEQWRFVQQHLLDEGRTYAWMTCEFEKAFGETVKKGVWARLFEQDRDRRILLQGAINRTRIAAQNARQLRHELKESGEVMGDAALDLIAQQVFEMATDSNCDLNALNGLAKTIIAARAQTFEREKFVSSLKTKVKLGLEALQEEIKGNAEALDLFNRLSAAVDKSIA
jgi:hypothetical protein